ncbi:ADP-ribosyltransferase [Phascolarctobacterium sp.]|uniref:ADP-ribosyltransferase n=1 Tax=Phascolarctobacterium sp. TaxID=2049039 RepID=UPI0025D53240|nr:ADP-ribosyltransferase [Phascolarctobacterium sp.]
MSKKLTSKQQKEQLNNLFAVYNKRLGRLYSDYVKKLTSLGYGEDVLEDDALFNFDNFPQLKARLNDIFNDYYQNSLLCYKSGITDGVALAYNHDEMVIGGYSVLTDKAIRVARDTAAATFISNRLKTKNGLNLTQIIWNYCQQTKSEFEMAMSNTIADGIKKGSSAEEVGKSIRKYLNDPDMMYRRYHTIKIQKNGKKKDVVTWRRRRIIDGKVRFVEEPLEKVGMGVYRSARKNALRVARTEINAAYHKARNERWQNEPFVIGQYIHVSPQHNIDDICNDLEGRYPKDYIWVSWHAQCICTSDPITIQGEEKKAFYKRLMAGEDMSNYVSPFTVLTMPEKYNQYIKDNSEAIVKAGMRGKLAWHLQDNTKYWAHLLSPSDRKKLGLKAVSSKELILAKAKERHALRTKEQIDKIQSRWDKHRRDYYNGLVHNLLGSKSVTDIKSQDLFERYYAIRYAIKDKKSASEIASLFDRFKRGYQTKLAWTDRKVAMNVMKVAANYGETDVSSVLSALKAADYTLARKEAKTLANAISAIKKDELSLSVLIPDVNKWHKQFTSQELHGVYDAVEAKLAQWQSLTLEQKAKKLQFEAINFLGGNMHGVQQKYATWKVSQAAYLKKLDEVNTAIDWININKAYADVKGYSTQSKVYHKILFDLKNAMVAQDKDLAKQLIQEAQDKKNSLIQLKAKRAANKDGNGSIPFDADAYSQARKDAAVWAKNTKDADDVLRAKCGEVWRNATDEEKNAIFGYTSSYHNINEPLRGLTYYGSAADTQLGLDRIPLMESIINKSYYDKDIWLQRGGGLVELKKFGLSNYAYATDAEIMALVGKEGTEGAFTSAGVAKGKDFGGNVITNIYAPRGTKMMYAEPYSSFGNGSGRSWDGIAKQSTFGSESEIILQRGTTFRVTKVEKSGNTWYIDVEVINQDVLPFPYIGGYPYK